MSGSEDGQLRSPGEELLSDDEHDTDSLDIKPPQVNYARESSGSGSRRKEDRKSAKEKRHSKERRHRDHSNRDYDRELRNSGGAVSGMSDRRGDVERREHRRDDVEQRYHHRSAYEDNREMLLSKSDRRYQKHYERNNEVIGSRSSGAVTATGNQSYHYQQQQQQQQPQSYHHQAQMHMQGQRQEYYEQRSQSYHSGSSAVGGRAVDYYSSRHQSYTKHSIHDENYELQQRERRKYHYEHNKDAESLEQDLRSRLISKRHKYVNSNDDDDDEQYEMRVERHDYDHMAGERDYEERERKLALSKSERHRLHHEKQQSRESVIEVLDSPELVEKSETHQKRSKHKRHHKEKVEEMRGKQRVISDDPELLARREKFLAAEREKEKRMEELEARREQKRERKDMLNALSPSAVAASVTAGLNVVVKRKSNDGHGHSKQKRSKRTKGVSDDDDELGECENDDDDDSATEDDDEMDEDDDDEDSDSSSDSANEASEKSFRKTKKLEKKHSKVATPLDSNDEIELPESPLSIGELSKSPPKHDAAKKRSAKHRSDVEKRMSHSPHSESERSHSRSVSPSHSRSNSRLSQSRSRSRTRSRSHSSQSGSSRSRSRSPHSDSAHSHSSRSHHSRSRTGSEDRNLQSNKEPEDNPIDIVHESLAADKLGEVKKKPVEIGPELPVCDDKGVPLPNYFPGVQGCRSVEEFQYLNRIAEGTYGVVYRAREKRTNEIVAVKRLKMEKEKEGFPITSLREINTLLKGQHPNIVTVREIVCSNKMIFIVMDYVEHDLKSLMETMKSRKQSFFPAEVKCLTQQLLSAIAHLHDNWILHRDLKTSNLLLSHKGILKVGDFGLAREYGSPLKHYTSLVVTLWYRAPELLLCSPEYSTPIDIWSVGCVFAEFLQMTPLFPGQTEIEEITRIFKELGTPNEKIWPGYQDLPAVKNLLSQNSTFPDYPASSLRKRFNDKTSDAGINLLQGLLTYDPKQRLTADAALKHSYFKELPPPIDPSMFPTWPAKSELGTRKTLVSSPKPPSGGSQFKQLGRDDIVPSSGAGNAGGANNKVVTGIITGNKKTAANTGFVLNAGIDQRQLAMGPGFSLRF